MNVEQTLAELVAMDSTLLQYNPLIKKHIKEIAEKRGIRNAYGLQKAFEVSPTVAAKLRSGNFEMIGLGTLDKLWRVLKTQPGRLLSYEEKSA